MKLQLCPDSGALRRRAQILARRRRGAVWPRLFAQHLASRQIFEVSRQLRDCHPGGVAAFACDFGPGWHVWAEHCPQPHDLDAHFHQPRPARPVRPSPRRQLAITTPVASAE